MELNTYLPLLFFVIAFFYSSIGFGGGSSYLAVLSLSLNSFDEIRTTALILNITAVSIGTIVFIRRRIFNWSHFWPFVLLSIPMSYLGAQLKFSEKIFFLLLGVLLIFSGMTLISKISKSNPAIRTFSTIKKLTLGGSIGFLAGCSGIGGGVFLSPFLNMMKWKNPLVIASLASFFIFVNSAAGLIGLYQAHSLTIDENKLLILVAAVSLGSISGSLLSVKKMNFKSISLFTAILVSYVGLRLILLHGFDIYI